MSKPKSTGPVLFNTGVEQAAYNPHLPCDLQGGHIWIKVVTKNDLDQDIKLTVCQNCKKVSWHEN